MYAVFCSVVFSSSLAGEPPIGVTSAWFIQDGTTILVPSVVWVDRLHFCPLSIPEISHAGMFPLLKLPNLLSMETSCHFEMLCSEMPLLVFLHSTLGLHCSLWDVSMEAAKNRSMWLGVGDIPTGSLLCLSSQPSCGLLSVNGQTTC